MKKIYYGGKIITMHSETEGADAVLTEDGVVLAVGTWEEIRQKAGENVKFCNLEGKTLLPAFLDSHSHITLLAQNLGKADLSDARSFADIEEILKRFIKENDIKEGVYVRGYGYDQNMLAEKVHPDKTLLDKVTTCHPVYISHVSSHMGVANSMALKLAGIDETCSEPAELVGRFVDSKEPNGYVAERGMIGIYQAIAQIPVDWEACIKEAQQIYLQNGILTIQDGASTPQLFEMLKKLGAEGILYLDINVMLMADKAARKVTKEQADYVGGYKDHVKIAGYKLVLDGSPQGKTAWLSKPYQDGKNGNAWLSDEDVYQGAKWALEDHMQLLVHCNGDAASEQFLDAYEKAYYDCAQTDEEKRGLRPVMVHCQTVREDQVKRMAPVGMMPAVFVDHVYYWGDVHYENLGDRRAEHISPTGWMKTCGLPYTFHQDAPVVKPDMLRTIRSAAERKTRSGRLLGEMHKVSVYEALQAVTLSAAYQYHEEDMKGSICEGKRADFVILDKNPLETEVSELTDIKVLAAICKDELLYRNEELTKECMGWE